MRRYAMPRPRDRRPRFAVPEFDFDAANAALAEHNRKISIDITAVLRRVSAGETWSEALRKERPQ